MLYRWSWSSFFFIFFLILSGCGSKKPTGYNHLLVEKEPKIREIAYLPLEYVFFRENDSVNKLYFRVDPQNFLPKYDSLGKLSIRYQIQLEVRTSQLGSKILFQENFDRVSSDSVPILDSLRLILPEQKTVFYELKIVDVNKNVAKTITAFWERESDFIPEDFLFVTEKNNQILTRPFIFGEKVFIRSSKTDRQFKVKLYQTTQNPATAMYEIEDNPLYAKIQPTAEHFVDITAFCALLNGLETETFCRVESVSEEKNRPFECTKLQSNQELSIQPLVYLLGPEENVSLNTWVKFWSNASGNDVFKAEKLIKEFNRRVKFANDHFSSHKLGWKTDRGMMYILHGPPDRISEDVRSEIWSYGFTSSVATSFIFVRNPTNLHSKDYILERNISYRDIATSAVQRWCNGWIRFGVDGNQ